MFILCDGASDDAKQCDCNKNIKIVLDGALDDALVCDFNDSDKIVLIGASDDAEWILFEREGEWYCEYRSGPTGPAKTIFIFYKRERDSGIDDAPAGAKTNIFERERDE